MPPATKSQIRVVARIEMRAGVRNGAPQEGVSLMAGNIDNDLARELEEMEDQRDAVTFMQAQGQAPDGPPTTFLLEPPKSWLAGRSPPPGSCPGWPP